MIVTSLNAIIQIYCTIDTTVLGLGFYPDKLHTHDEVRIGDQRVRLKRFNLGILRALP